MGGLMLQLVLSSPKTFDQAWQADLNRRSLWSQHKTNWNLIPRKKAGIWEEKKTFREEETDWRERRRMGKSHDPEERYISK